MRGGRGWHGHGGISMNDEKDGIVEKACTVWSALGRELRLCLEITKVIRTITESMWRRSNETFAILSASIRTFYEWIIFSALKKLMDIRWIANLRSSAWILSWLWRVKYENLACTPTHLQRDSRALVPRDYICGKNTATNLVSKTSNMSNNWYLNHIYNPIHAHVIDMDM